VRPHVLPWAAAFFAFAFCVPSLALLDLVSGLFPAGDDAPSSTAMSNVAFGVLGVVLISPAFARLVRNGPDAPVAMSQLAAVVLALIAASVWSGEAVGVLGALVVLVPLGIVWALHPARRSPFRRDSWMVGDPWMLVCAVVLLVPACACAGVTAAHGRAAAPPENSFAFVPSHWAAMTAALLALGLVALLAAAHGGRWTVSTVCVAVAVVLFGLAFVINPEVPSSGGRVWGVAAVVWAGLWLVAARRAPVRGVRV
jgi:hypothetical protein